MLFSLPSSDTLYRALLARDDSYEGRAYVAVTSTGIFCRLTCPARNPKPENCQFFDSVAGCIEAGFRPCKRCHPLGPMADADPAIAHLLTALDSDPTRRWREADVAALGFDPSTIRRSFKRQFGLTFLDMARHRRLREGFTALSEGGSVMDAQVAAGFDSPSAFRAAFASLVGISPGHFSADALLRADWIDTPLGPMLAIASAHALHLLEFIDRKALRREIAALKTHTTGGFAIGRFAPTDQIEAELADFFAGTRARFDTPLALHASPFTKDVWRALRTIPAGQTRAYSQIATQIGRPSATRAVARANGANQIAIAIPCHRVIGADGSLTGYGGGLWRKQRLLDIEQQYAKDPPP